MPHYANKPIVQLAQQESDADFPVLTVSLQEF